MLRPIIGEDIEMTTVLAPALERVMADPGQIQQVLMNLATGIRRMFSAETVRSGRTGSKSAASASWGQPIAM